MTLSLAAEFLGRIPKITCTFIVVTRGRVSYYLQFAQITITVTAIKSVQFMRYVQYTTCYQYCRDRNVDQHFVYIVDLLSCLHRPHRNVHRHRVDIVFFFILFHRQHRRNSNIDRHRIDIVHLLSCLYRQHRNVVRHRVYIVPFLRCNQCKFNIGSTSYTLPCGRCKRQRNVSKVDGVNSISVKHRRCCEVDDVNVKEISTMSYDVMLILYQCCIHRHGDNIEKGICIGHVWRMSDC